MYSSCFHPFLVCQTSEVSVIAGKPTDYIQNMFLKAYKYVYDL